ncbi:tryptophan-rich sensory protein [bacterium]|nr:tryptophan-rich sensory protein [bacterium]
MNMNGIRRWLLPLSVAGTIFVNFLANYLPLNGLNTGEISDRFQVLFVPAGYVFSIWGIIYIGLIALAVFQSLPAQRDHRGLARTGWLLVMTGAANAGWLFLWHYERFPWTVPVMLALLVLLILVYLRLDIGKTAVSRAEKWCLHIPVSLYLGWICVATIANISSTLYSLQWDGWGISPVIWTLALLTVTVVLALFMLLQRRDTAFLLVFVWALAGIGVKQSAHALISTGAWTGAVLAALMAIRTLLPRRTA